MSLNRVAKILFVDLLAGFAVALRFGSLASNKEWVLPGSDPSAGQSVRVASFTGGVATFEWFTPGTGTGGVTSVGLSLPNIFTNDTPTINTSGTFGIGLTNQAANRVWAGPATGADAAPTFRALVAADIPNLNASILTSGTLDIARIPVGTGANQVASGNDSRFHTQNTDTGTTAQSFQLNSGAGGVRLKHNGGALEARNAADSDYADVIVRNLTVTGTSTTIQSETVEIADNIFVLNSNFTSGTPTENAGFAIKRGALADANLIWDESSDDFKGGVAGSEFSFVRRRDFSITNANLTNGVATITHNLGKQIVMVVLGDNQTPPQALGVGVTFTSTTQLSLDFGGAITGTMTLAVFA